jgi:formiminoglutamase
MLLPFYYFLVKIAVNHSSSNTYYAMLDLSIFFEPINLITSTNEYDTTLGNKLIKHTTSFPAIERNSIVFIGVCEDRGSRKQELQCNSAPNAIRAELYKLYHHFGTQTIYDLGNINAGATAADTYFAVSQVIQELIKNNCTPILLGGTQDLTYANYLAYQALEQVVNIVNIDARFDLGQENEALNEHSYLSKIVMHQPNFLFNYSNIGYQSFLNSSEDILLMEKMYFDVHRVGAIQKNMEEAEPILRNADIVSFDINAIRRSEAPAGNNNSPNGFNGQEACQLARYAGASDKVSSFGVYGLSPLLDEHNTTAALAAQIIWFFIDGVSLRKNEMPSPTNANFMRYHVTIEDGNHQLEFYKSKLSEKWWMAVPYPPDKRLKFERHTNVPCSYNDYLKATHNELPDKWWETYQKLF